MPGEGVEPTHPFGYQILSLARLPIPPSGPQGQEYTALHVRESPLAALSRATTIDRMKFCPTCAAPVTLRTPDGDHLPRSVCTSCGAIHYRNPKVVTGCVPEYGGQILICRRAIEPRRGYWTIPAGFMETGETLQQAAARECLEEALARVEIGSLCAIVHVLHAEQVHVMFRATLAEPSFGVGHESLETKLCGEQEIPWPEIAFASVEYTLHRYFADRAAGRANLHFHTIA